MKSYGRITVTAIKKVGVLMVNPSCNMPLIVTYDPDNDSYTPDWSSTNLVLCEYTCFSLCNNCVRLLIYSTLPFYNCIYSKKYLFY